MDRASVDRASTYRKASTDRMPSLRAQLTVRLDVSGLVGAFVGDASAAAGPLAAITDPTPAEPLAAVQADVGALGLDAVGGRVQVLVGQAGALAGSLPLAADVVRPVTEAIALVERLAIDPQAGALDVQVRALLAELSAALDGPREDGVLGALHAIALALGSGGGAAATVRDLLARVTAAAGVSLPFGTVGQAVGALDGTVRVTGGLMVLDSVAGDVERLTRLMSARLDPRVLDRELAALDAALAFDGGELADAMAAVDAGDLATQQRIAVRVAAAAAALDHLREEYSAALAFGEATLVYLDVDALQAELDAGRTLIRTGDLAPLNALCTQLAAALAPHLREDLLAGPRQELDALFASAEAQIAAVAARVAAFDVAALVAPLDEGLRLVTRPLDELTALLDGVRVAYQGALGTVRDAVAALPIRAVADAIRDLLAPIGRVLDAVADIVATVLGALQTAADATTAALGQVEGVVDALQATLDAFFAQVRDFLGGLQLDQVLGAVEANVRALATALEKARMEPYFEAAADAIETAAGVIDAVPFALLPESIKADVDAAVAPIKAADAGALAEEVEALLQITPDGRFAAMAELDAAVATLQGGFDALVEAVRAHEPRAALQPVDAKLHELSDTIAALSPAVTLQPLRDAIAGVQEALAGLDLDAPLAPVREAFATVTAAVEEFRPSLLLEPIEARITAARQQVVDVLRLPELEEALTTLHDRAADLLARYDADLLQRRLELAMEEFLAVTDAAPSVSLLGGLGAVVAGLLGGTGLRVYPVSFEHVLAWIGGESASAALNARVLAAAAAVGAAREAVAAMDAGGRGAAAAARVTRVRAAVGPLLARVGDGAPVSLTLSAAEPRLDAGAVFGFLESNRARFAALLGTAGARIEGVAQAGFSDADVRVENLRAAVAPLDPARAYVRRLLQQVGLTGFELGAAGVLRAALAVVPPARLVGLVRPIFDALRGRVQALVDAALAPLAGAVTRARAALDAVDLAPLLASLDAVHAEVLAQIQLLSPDALLGPTLAEVDALRQTLVGADPLAPVLAILNTVRDTVARVLAKLSLERLLAVPLAVFDEVLATLDRLDVAALVAPLRAQLDDIAAQVDAGLDRTVTAFERLQDALPSGGGGSTGGVDVDVAVVVG